MAGRWSARASDPAELTMPTTSMLSLSSTGRPCSGPRTLPALRSASSAIGVGQRLRVQLDHRVERRTGLVDGGDAGQIRLGQRPRGERCRRPSGRAPRRRSAPRRRRRAQRRRPAPRATTPSAHAAFTARTASDERSGTSGHRWRRLLADGALDYRRPATGRTAPLEWKLAVSASPSFTPDPFVPRPSPGRRSPHDAVRVGAPPPLPAAAAGRGASASASRADTEVLGHCHWQPERTRRAHRRSCCTASRGRATATTCAASPTRRGRAASTSCGSTSATAAAPST